MEDEDHAADEPEVDHVGVVDEEDSHSVVQAVLVELGGAVDVAREDMR